jgi:hypothetical protein
LCKQAGKKTDKKYKEEKHKRSSPDQAVLHLSLQLPGMLAGAPPGLEHLNPSPSDLATTVGTEHHRLQQTDMAFFLFVLSVRNGSSSPSLLPLCAAILGEGDS